MFTIVLTIVSIVQWREIRSSKADTQRLLNALEKQARAAEDQAKAAASQATSAKAYVEAAKENANAASSSAELARDAAAFSRLSFQASQRAYVIESKIRVGCGTERGQPHKAHHDLQKCGANAGAARKCPMAAFCVPDRNEGPAFA